MKNMIKKVAALSLSLSMAMPAAVSAQELTLDDALLGIVSSLDDFSSFSGNVDGTINFKLSDGDQGDVTYNGTLDMLTKPSVQFGFEGEATAKGTNDGEPVNEEIIGKYYLVGDELASFTQSTEDDDVEGWEKTPATSFLGMTPAELSKQLPLFVSMAEGMVKSYVFSEDSYALIKEKSTVEQSENGYTITINSFDTEEEWTRFFGVANQLNSSINDSDDFDDELAEIQANAKVFADNLNFKLVIKTDANFFVQSIEGTVDTTGPLDFEGSDEDEIPEELHSTFTYTVAGRDNVNTIELPAEAQ